MLYKDFFNTHARNLYDMWVKYLPDNDSNVVSDKKYYTVYEDDKPYVLVDDGKKILGFREFMFLAYENSIP